MGLFATWRHIRRLADVEEGLRDLQAQMKALDREWSETHDDLTRMLGKISKRAKAIERDAAASEASATELSASGTDAPTNTPLTFGSKTATILRQIATRRGG